MAAKTTKRVMVLYKYVDEAHFFVSDDKSTIGLCVAHKDLETAWHSVGQALATIWKENHRVDAEFSPEMTFEAFSRWRAEMQRLKERGFLNPGIAGRLIWIWNEAG